MCLTFSELLQKEISLVRRRATCNCKRAITNKAVPHYKWTTDYVTTRTTNYSTCYQCTPPCLRVWGGGGLLGLPALRCVFIHWHYRRPKITDTFLSTSCARTLMAHNKARIGQLVDDFDANYEVYKTTQGQLLKVLTHIERYLEAVDCTRNWSV